MYAGNKNRLLHLRPPTKIFRLHLFPKGKHLAKTETKPATRDSEAACMVKLTTLKFAILKTRVQLKSAATFILHIHGPTLHFFQKGA